MNEAFEESLTNFPEWGPYLKDKMIHILDGNNRSRTWMDMIAQGEGYLDCF